MTGLAVSGTTAVLLVGLSFRSAPVPVLEKASVPESDMPDLQATLRDTDAITETMVLSTCNRMEFYAATTAFHPALDHIVETVARFAGLTVEELEPHLYVRYADAAAEHMLNVASGLDSMVVGEQQIIGQLRAAYQAADEHGLVGNTLHALSQRALHTGKRVHTETAVDETGASMVSFAVGRAMASLGVTDLAGRRAVIVGAGAMASLASSHLGRLGIEHVTVANRTVSRAENLAAHAREAGVPADAVSLADMPARLADADIVVSATGAVGTVIGDDAILSAMDGRGPGDAATARPMVLCDLSMPRDIDDRAGDVPGVTLLNIEELTTLAGDEAPDAHAARDIVREELTSYLEQQRVQSVVPTVKALRTRAAEVAREELAALAGRTPDMSDADRHEVERTVRRVVDKLLHAPTVQVKKLSTRADSARGGAVNYADALAELFNLQVGTSAAVSQVIEPGDAGKARIANVLTQGGDAAGAGTTGATATGTTGATGTAGTTATGTGTTGTTTGEAEAS